MNYSEGLSMRVVPPLSERILHHPSFLSLYMPTCVPFCLHGGGQTVSPIIPAEVFYTDPTVICGRRIPNLTGMTVFGFSRLNSPHPIMSACLAAPNYPDPFRFGQYPTRDLGSPTWRIHPRAQPRWSVIQLTQEEDQAVTNLLKLHHQEELPHRELLTAAHTDVSSVLNPTHLLTDPTFQASSADEAHMPVCHQVQGLWELLGGGWSDSEIEAADTLLSGFSQDKGDLLRAQDQYETATMGPDTPLGQKTEMQRDFGTSSGCVTCNCVRDSGDIWPEDRSAGDCSLVLMNNPPERPSSPSFSSKMDGTSEEQEVTDLERNAVHVLLSLRDIVT